MAVAVSLRETDWIVKDIMKKEASRSMRMKFQVHCYDKRVVQTAGYYRIFWHEKRQYGLPYRLR